MRRVSLILVAAATTAALAGGWFVIAADAQRTEVSPQMSTDSAELDPFEQRVREYLLNNPEVIMEALQLLQERQRTAEAENLRRTIVERSEEILNDPAAPVGGNPAGDVTLVEFFDYNCPYCRRVAPTMVELEEADPGSAYRLQGIPDPRARLAVRRAPRSLHASRASNVPFHNALMQADGQVTEVAVIEIAREVGLDTERLRADMQEPAIQEAIARNRQLANALGINGTPSFIIGREVVPGAVDFRTLQGLIARARRN